LLTRNRLFGLTLINGLRSDRASAMCPTRPRVPRESYRRSGEHMATQTVNYLPQIEKIDNSDAEQKAVDKSSQLVRDRIIGHSRWAEKARRLVVAHGAHDNTVIFEGESGTGKQFLARLVHQCSRYSEGPFASVSLGSTSEDAARAVLFGRTRADNDDYQSGAKGRIGA